MAQPSSRAPQLFEIPAGTPRSQCRTCKQEIYWIVTEKGRRMPVSVGGPGNYPPSEATVGIGISHFVDCEDRDLHRKPRRPPAA